MDRNKVGIWVISVLVVLKFLVMPFIDELNANTEKLKQNEISLSKFSQISQQSELVERDLQAINEYLSDLTGKMSSGSRAQVTTELFDYLNSLSDASDVELRNMRVGELQESSLNYYPVEFNASGSAHGLIKFIEKLESGEKFVVTAQMMMRKGRKSNTLTTNMVIYAVVKGGND